MLDTGDIFTAKSDWKYQLHSETQEDITPTPSNLQSEDLDSPNFLTPETLSEEEKIPHWYWTVKTQARILRTTYITIRQTLTKLKHLPSHQIQP